jgi:hypothetical protein
MSSYRYFRSRLGLYSPLAVVTWTLFIFLLLEDSPPIGLPGKRFYKRFDWKCPNCGRRQERGYPEVELERPYCDTNAKGKSHARIRMIRVAPANKDH